MFINLSNHPSNKWSKGQIDSAVSLGGNIVDVPFPNVPPGLTTLNVKDQARGLVAKLLVNLPDVVFVAGESTLMFAVVTLLLQNDILVVSATTERVVTESTNPDGSVSKNATFQFVQWRKFSR